MGEETESYVPRLWTMKEICARYQQVWQEGGSPSIEKFLSDVPGNKRAGFFRALLKVETDLRRKKKDSVSAADYLSRFPQFSSEIQDVFKDLPAVPPPTAAPVVKKQAPPPRPAPAIPAVSRIEMQVIAGPHKGAKFTFDQHDTFLVGRSTKAQLRLQGDPHFSRFHFRLEFNPPQCYLIDLGSRNGTFVNGKQVQECHLQSGDIISGGTTEMKILLDAADRTLYLPPPAAAPVIPESAAKREEEALPETQISIYPLAPALQSSPRADTAKKPEPLSQLPMFRLHAPQDAASVSIPGYDIQEELACGDLGTLYRAVQQKSQLVCALKVMRPAAAVAENALEKFVRECEILGQLNHPHIVKYIEHGTANGVLFIATEYLPAVRLSDHLRERSLADRVRICCGLMSQILGALEYAHQKSLVHREIKPGNIVICKEKNQLSAKLADFGVAKQFTNAGFSKLTQAGDVIGSLPFMAPEQFLNSREARPTADLYSAGATLYTWLAGHTPHDYPATRSQFLVVLEDAPLALDQRLPGIPVELAAFMQRALAKEPADRFASASEMRQSLKAAIKR